MAENKERFLNKPEEIKPEEVKEEWFEEYEISTGFGIDKSGDEYKILGGVGIIRHEGKKPLAEEQVKEQ